jgi:protein-S-isoprenylcysteine O-methyltransferase Ste14
MFLFFKVESKLEKLFKKPDRLDEEIIFEEFKSLKLFKFFNILLCCIASGEISYYSVHFSYLSIFASIFVAIGFFLRILAIKELGNYWSYNIKIYKKHQIIQTGIYRYLNHPAYLGNIYILGFFMIFNLYYTSLITTFFILLFGIWRAKIEDKYLSSFRCGTIK